MYNKNNINMFFFSDQLIDSHELIVHLMILSFIDFIVINITCSSRMIVRPIHFQ